MKFSIIIPVYNVEKYLRQCLDSVLAQTYPDWEAICVNDGSTDSSPAILKEYADKDKRIKVIHQSNMGVSGARNTGIRESQGDYLFFLDSDDWIDVEGLGRLSGVIEGEDVVCFNGVVYEENNDYYNQPDVLCNEEFEDGWSFYSKYACENRQFNFTRVWNKCYRRIFLLKNDLWFYPGIYHDDNLFTPIVCYYAKRVKQISIPIYYYRIRAGSIMTTSNFLEKAIDTVFIANYLSNFFVPISCIEKTTIYRIINNQYIAALRQSNAKDDGEIKNKINWKSFRKCSRTKLRHKVLFRLAKVSPALLRFLMQCHWV